MDAPHVDGGPKGKRKEIFESMPQNLESHVAFNFHFPWTGDEPWIFDE
jgi:hypothetical protein